MKKHVACAICVCLFTLGLGGSARADLASTRISLPKGPGSIEGLGNLDFSANLASGQVNYSIPIVVPPAVRSFGPALALSYDSGAGISEIALGWTLSGTISVRRRTQDGLPRFDGSDAFEVVGLGIPSELLEVAPNVFRPRFEDGSFLQARRDGEQWELRTKAGVTHALGTARLQNGRGDIVTYLLDRSTDARGHTVKYEWQTTGQYPLLERVVWNESSADAANEVLFEYEKRPDAMRLYSSGIRQELTQRLSRISVFHGGRLVRRYDLTFSADSHPRLAGVTLIGADGQGKLPTQQFRYTGELDPAVSSAVLVEMRGAPGRAPGTPEVDLIDLNGDSLPDLLVGAAGEYSSALNVDGVTWEPRQVWEKTRSPSFSLGGPGVHVADFDGDGAADLLTTAGGGQARYLARSNEGWFEEEVLIQDGLDLDLTSPEVRLADFDGDRRIDVARTTAFGLTIARNRDGTAFESADAAIAIDPDQDISFADDGTDLCDINGDRVLDICKLRSGSLIYYLGRGRGHFEPAESGEGVPEFDANQPYVLRDLDGDGWDDLVRIGSDEVSYALARGEGHFESPRTFDGVPVKGPSTQTFFADMNGSGSLDIVWVEVSSGIEAAWRYLELFPRGRAGLLVESESGQGKRQTIEYEAAARFAADARAASGRWSSRLNVALPVVARITIDTGLGDPPLVREYEYADGTYDPAQRTFAAFGVVTVRELGDEFTPTLVTLRRFDCGLSLRTLRGALLWEEQSADDGQVFSRRTYDYLTRRLDVALDGRAVEYGYLSALLTEIVEGHEDAITLRSHFEQDEFGNVILEQNWGVVDGDDPLALGDETIIVRTFASDEDEWVLGHLASETLLNAAGEKVAGSRRRYDGPAFVGLEDGVVERGELTREEAWVGPGEDDFELVNATRYDEHGLPVETKDARGGGRFLRWDGAHAHVIFEGVKLKSDDREGEVRLFEEAVFDDRFGVVLESIDYGGGVTRYEYDAFGRLTAVIRPGDSSELPTLRYRYEPGAPLSLVVTDARIESGQALVERREDVFDGLGRKRASFVLDAESWLMAGVESYDARGQVRKTHPPRWVSEHERQSPPLGEQRDGSETWRDALGRPVRTKSPEGIATRTSYQPLAVSHWDGEQANEESGFEHTPIVTISDGQQRIIRHERSLGGKVVASSYSYDAAGELLTRVDSDGHRQSFTYDGRGRRLGAVDPDQGSHTFVHDACGNLTEHIYPDGGTSTWSYDLAGRTVRENWDGEGEAEVIREYDHGPPEHRGKLVRAVEPSGAVEYAYDLRGNLDQTRYTIEGREYVVASRFDARDREVEHIYPDGSRLSLHRNARGLPSEYGQLVRIEYSAEGTETKRRFSTGVELSSHYDRDHRRTRIDLEDADGKRVGGIGWSYDDAGNLVGRSDESTRGARSISYSYDNLYRLTAFRDGEQTLEWTYSPSGNLLSRRSTRAALDAPSIDYRTLAHAPDALGGRSIRYDARGRMTDDGLRAYQWDGMSRLARVSRGPARVESVYGQDGARRIRREIDESGRRSTTHFLDAWSEVRDGELVRYVVHGGERIVRLKEGRSADQQGGTGRSFSRPHRAAPGDRRTGTVLGLFGLILVALGAVDRRGRMPRRGMMAVALLFGGLAGCGQGESASGEAIDELQPGDRLLVSDQVGSSWAETDERGRVLASPRFEPFGAVQSGHSQESRLFAGNPRDGSVELDHMGERFYAPDLGLWTSADAVSLFEPERQITADFAAAHSYAYANLRPLVAVDRDGRYGQYVAAGAGVLVGGGLEALRQYYQYGAVRNWALVAGSSALGGVLGYGLTMAPTTLLQGAATSAVSSVALGVGRRLAESGGRDPGTLGQVLTDAAFGAASGLLSKGLGQLQAAKSAPTTPVLSQAAAGADDAVMSAGGGAVSGAVGGAGRSLSPALSGTSAGAAAAAPWVSAAAQGAAAPAASGSLWTLGWSAQAGGASAFGVMEFALQPSGMIGIALRVP